MYSPYFICMYSPNFICICMYSPRYKFLVNKNFPTRSKQHELIQQLNADPAYQQHLLLCKVNMSLCQINKSVEVDYYKVRCNGEFRTIIPHNFSKATGDYLEEITKRYTFSERDRVIMYVTTPIHVTICTSGVVWV